MNELQKDPFALLSIDASESFRSRVDASIKAMDWLEKSDQANVHLARALADELDAVQMRATRLRDLLDTDDMSSGLRAQVSSLAADCEVGRVLKSLAPQLLATLRELGGTALSRREVDQHVDNEESGRLAALRRAAGR